MPGRTILISGVPGIGKTTVCQQVLARGAVSETVSMGNLIRSAAIEAGREGDARADLNHVVTKPVILRAKDRYAEMVSQAGDHEVFLLDSHTATAGSRGIRSTPDPAVYLSRLNLAGCVFLTAHTKTVKRRRELDRDNPRHGDIRELALLQEVLMLSALLVAVSTATPLHVVAADGDISAVEDSVVAAIEEILSW